MCIKPKNFTARPPEGPCKEGKIKAPVFLTGCRVIGLKIASEIKKAGPLLHSLLNFNQQKIKLLCQSQDGYS